MDNASLLSEHFSSGVIIVDNQERNRHTNSKTTLSMTYLHEHWMKLIYIPKTLAGMCKDDILVSTGLG